VSAAGQPWVGLTAPPQLGRSAAERVGGNSTYMIFWQRDYAVELVAVDMSLSTTTTGSPASTTGTGPPPATSRTVPITPGLQKILRSAARYQNSLLRIQKS
jgi:hypothetical protein